MSPGFAEELKECSPNELIKIHAEAGDVSAILRQELADSEVKTHLSRSCNAFVNTLYPASS